MTYSAIGRAPGYMGTGRRGLSDITWSKTKDPLIAASSAFAATIITEASKLPPSQRKALVVSVLNRVRPGTASDAEHNKRKMLREGKAADQATFDGMRLAIVNSIADRLVQAGKSAQTGRPVDGLGLYPWDPWSFTQQDEGLNGLGNIFEDAWNSVVKPAMCVTGAVAGTIVSPAAGAISQGQSAIGCNAAELRTQRNVARLQAEQAATMERMQAAQLAAQAQQQKRTTTLLIAGGVGVAVLAIAALVILK